MSGGTDSSETEVALTDARDEAARDLANIRDVWELSLTPDARTSLEVFRKELLNAYAQLFVETSALLIRARLSTLAYCVSELRRQVAAGSPGAGEARNACLVALGDLCLHLSKMFGLTFDVQCLYVSLLALRQGSHEYGR